MYVLATGPENILKRRISEAYFRKLIVQSLYKQLDNNILTLLRYGYNKYDDTYFHDLSMFLIIWNLTSIQYSDFNNA